MPHEVLPTANPDRGFCGTTHHAADPAEARAIAMPAITAASSCPDAAVRDFPDSRHGRRLADDVGNGLAAALALQAAIDAAVERWTGWTIDRRTERETGVPRGLPCLPGFFSRCEIEADAFA